MSDDFGLARNTDPTTSHEAAASISTTQLERVVLEVIRTFGARGCIADEVTSRLSHLRCHTVIPRFRPLVNKGLVVVAGKRLGGAGRNQNVLIAKEFLEEVK